MLILVNKAPYFEFICVTVPGLKPPLEESGYRSACTYVRYIYNLNVYNNKYGY